MYSNHSNGGSVTRASSDAINGSAKHGMKKIRRSFAETKAQYSVFALYTLWYAKVISSTRCSVWGPEKLYE